MSRPTKKRRIERSALANARDMFFATEKAGELCDGNTHGQYLKNRLIVAFYAGWDYCKKNDNELQSENTRLKEELEKHRWIPVSERLPEKDGAYQVFRKGNRAPTTRTYFCKDGWVTHDIVTHWKPITLPEE